MPFSVGAQGAGMDIEPFTTIRSFNPLCYWRMGEASGTLINSGSAASKNATATALTYSATKIATRSPQTAITFNGTTAFADVAAGVIGGTSPTFSIGCWINTTTSANVALICQRDATNGTSGFEFKLSSGVYLSFQGVTTSGVNDFSFLSEQLNPLNDGIPHFVSATVRSDTVILYVDGAEVGNNGGRVGGTWSATPKIFLGQINGGTQRFAGTMSDAFITSQVLTQADHYRIWRNGMINDPTPRGSTFLDATVVPLPTSTTTITGLDISDMTIEPPLEPDRQTPVVSYTRGVNSLVSAWYKFTSVAAGDRLRINCYGQTPYFSYHYLELYKDIDGTIDNLQHISTGLSYVTSAYQIVEANTTYYARIRPKELFPGVVGDLTYDFGPPPAPPANDNFADATLLDVTSAGSIAGTTDGATIQYPTETDYWDTGLYTSVWYKFVAGATGTITLTDTSGNESIIAAWVNCANIAQAQTDGAIDGDSPALALAVTSGNTYHIQISDYANGQPFTLGWTTIV